MFDGAASVLSASCMTWYYRYIVEMVVVVMAVPIFPIRRHMLRWTGEPVAVVSVTDSIALHLFFFFREFGSGYFIFFTSRAGFCMGQRFRGDTNSRIIQPRLSRA